MVSRRSMAFLVVIILLGCTSNVTPQMPVDGDEVPGTMQTSGGTIGSNDLIEDPPVDHYFIENLGQLPDRGVVFYGMTSSGYVAFQKGSVVFGLTSQALDAQGPLENGLEMTGLMDSPLRSERGTKQTIKVVRFIFEEARDVIPIARSPLPGVYNYLLGDDPSKWTIGVNRYSMVIYEDLYEGIDLIYRTDG